MAVHSQETDAGHLCARIHVQGSCFFIRLPSCEEEAVQQLANNEDKNCTSGLQLSEKDHTSSEARVSQCNLLSESL